MRRIVYMSLKYDMSSSRFVVASVGIGKVTETAEGIAGAGAGSGRVRRKCGTTI